MYKRTMIQMQYIDIVLNMQCNHPTPLYGKYGMGNNNINKN